MNHKLLSLLKSRKFWAAVVGLIVAIVGERAGIDAEQLAAGIGLLVAYIIGTALEDGLSNR
jgi:hypothetical protein